MSAPQEINEYIKSLHEESRAIKQQVFEICWYMRGGITLAEAYTLSYDDRAYIHKLIEQNIERTKESGLALL